MGSGLKDLKQDFFEYKKNRKKDKTRIILLKKSLTKETNKRTNYYSKKRERRIAELKTRLINELERQAEKKLERGSRILKFMENLAPFLMREKFSDIVLSHSKFLGTLTLLYEVTFAKNFNHRHHAKALYRAALVNIFHLHCKERNFKQGFIIPAELSERIKYQTSGNVDLYESCSVIIISLLLDCPDFIKEQDTYNGVTGIPWKYCTLFN